MLPVGTSPYDELKRFLKAKLEKYNGQKKEPRKFASRFFEIDNVTFISADAFLATPSADEKPFEFNPHPSSKSSIKGQPGYTTLHQTPENAKLYFSLRASAYAGFTYCGYYRGQQSRGSLFFGDTSYFTTSKVTATWRALLMSVCGVSSVEDVAAAVIETPMEGPVDVAVVNDDEKLRYRRMLREGHMNNREWGGNMSAQKMMVGEGGEKRDMGWLVRGSETGRRWNKREEDLEMWSRGTSKATIVRMR